ncbi:MAG: Sua5/YciO/YrdC/YwlC family protein [Gammaproteobacteria bacterium]
MRDLQKALLVLQQGGIIAYPTEAVFGLGCDPSQPAAVASVIHLKRRDPSKGLILIAHTFECLQSYIDISMVPPDHLKQILASWPGPYTWIFPTKASVSPLLTGRFNSLAVRVTAHPIARGLCEGFGGPIVSTSANPEGLPPAKTRTEVEAYFGHQCEVVDDQIGDLAQPTAIRDALTLAYVRR